MAINAGSSTLKFKLYEMPEEKVLCAGNCERIGHEDGIFTIKFKDQKERLIVPFKDHSDAVNLLIEKLLSLNIIDSLNDLKALGHRIVQGGKYFNKTVEFTKENEQIIESLIPLAPLHNAAHLIGFRAFKKEIPNCLETATFDTAFHQTMDVEDYLFPIPYEISEKYDIRRYGAHGTSHQYVSEIAIEKYLDKKSNTKIITCHLGSGASISAVKDGKCVATSMGLTPLGGIMMGTRTGDMDPSVFNFVQKNTQLSCEEVYQMFNKKSGFLGVSGVSNDTRDITEASKKGNKQAIIAMKLFARRVADFVGQYFVRLGGCDAIIFTAGIGENGNEYRELILENLKDALHLEYSSELNDELIRGKEGLMSTNNSKIKIIVIPTDEEVMIARDAYKILIEKRK